MPTKIRKLITLLLVLGGSQFYDVILAETQPVSSAGIVTWEEVNALKDNNTVLLIDVREPNELLGGSIPASINIPLNTLEDTLKNLSAEEFSQKYHREKPKFDTTLVFSCTVGVRSTNAQNIAIRLGYKNAKNYLGSWSDWESHLNQ